MIRRLIAPVALAAAFLVRAPASAYQVVDPHVYQTGETLTQSSLNAPLQTLYTVLNGGIDATNIGPVGLYASQIKPTTSAQATFGGSLGYTIAPSSPSAVPFTVIGPNATTADVMDAFLAGTKAFWIDSSGVTHIPNVQFGSTPTFTGAVTANQQVNTQVLALFNSALNTSVNTPLVSNDQAPVAGINTWLPAGSTYGERTLIEGTSGTTIRQLDVNGNESIAGHYAGTGLAITGAGSVSGTLTAGGVSTANVVASSGITTGNLQSTTGTFTSTLASGSLSTGPVSATAGSFSGALSAPSAAISGALTSGGNQVLVAPGSGTRVSAGTVAISFASCASGADCGLGGTTAYAGGAFGATPVCTLTPQAPNFALSIALGSTSASQLGVEVSNTSNSALGSSSFNAFYVCVGS